MSYSIEIFTDEKARHDIDITPALGGVALLEMFQEEKTKPIVGNTLRITTSSGPEIYTNRIKWPRNLEADMNILLTDRRLTRVSNTSPNFNRLGLASPISASRLAIVSTVESPEVVTEVVAHELGHLLQVPEVRKHCKNTNCIMQRELRTKTVEVPDTSHFINVIRNIIGVPAMKQVQEYDPQFSYCGDCYAKIDKQLGKLRLHDL